MITLKQTFPANEWFEVDDQTIEDAKMHMTMLLQGQQWVDGARASITFSGCSLSMSDIEQSHTPRMSRFGVSNWFRHTVKLLSEL